MTSPYTSVPTSTRMQQGMANAWQLVEADAKQQERKKNQQLYLETLQKYNAGDKSLRSQLIRLHSYAPPSTTPSTTSSGAEEYKLGAYAQGMVDAEGKKPIVEHKYGAFVPSATTTERKTTARYRPTATQMSTQMARQMDQVKRMLRSPVERIQFFSLLKELLNVKCGKNKYSDSERERLNLLAGQWQSNYPITKELFATVIGKEWSEKDCAAGFNYFPMQTVSTPFNSAIVSSMLPYPTALPTSGGGRTTAPNAPAPNAPDGMDGWW